MKAKKAILTAVWASVFLAVFNIFFFVFKGTDNEDGVWVAYGVIHFAYLVTVLSPFFFKRKTDVRLIGLSLVTISSVYFVTAFATNILFIIGDVSRMRPVVLTNIIIFALYLLVIIPAIIAADDVNVHAENVDIAKRYTKDIPEQLQLIKTLTTDRELIAAIEKVSDLIGASPLMSNPKAYGTENEIAQRVDSLRAAVINGDVESAKKTVSAMNTLANQRNILVKTNR